MPFITPMCVVKVNYYEEKKKKFHLFDFSRLFFSFGGSFRSLVSEENKVQVRIGLVAICLSRVIYVNTLAWMTDMNVFQ